MSRNILIIQTAFTGDVVLSTSLMEKLHETNVGHKIDVLVRKGNESLFTGHPFLRDVLVWDKKKNKYKDLLRVLKLIRKRKYDTVINLQRFASTGLLTVFSSAKESIGFNKNPLSFLFTKRIKHDVKSGLHEIERNQLLIAHLTDTIALRPKLYPTDADHSKVRQLTEKKYITIAPLSVWFTKTFPSYKWIELIQAHSKLHSGQKIYLLGSKEEYDHAENIKIKSAESNVINLCGSLSFLESTALMKNAEMNYVNDSAPMHLASSVNAPVTIIYCSTVPGFGFGPLSDRSRIIETKLSLNCRPCGLHGFKECPLTHFKCAHSVEITQVIA